jgi:hypothetical protein
LQRPEPLQERCRGRIRSVAASGSGTGALQGQDRERYRSVAGAVSGGLQRPGALQERCRGSIRSVAAAGALQERQGRYRSVAGACLVAENVRVAA